MEEKLYKQCRLCGCYYDVDEDSGEQLCNRCYLQLKIEKNKEKNQLKKGVKNNGLW